MKILDFEVGKKYTLEDKWEEGEYIYLTEEGYIKDEEDSFMPLGLHLIKEDQFVEVE